LIEMKFKLENVLKPNFLIFLCPFWVDTDYVVEITQLTKKTGWWVIIHYQFGKKKSK